MKTFEYAFWNKEYKCCLDFALKNYFEQYKIKYFLLSHSYENDFLKTNDLPEDVKNQLQKVNSILTKEQIEWLKQ